jgi:adenosylcobinamide amidohydrolase
LLASPSPISPPPPFALVVRDSVLILDLLQARTLISSAPFRGGLVQSRYIVNATVAADYCPMDVTAAIAQQLLTLGLPTEASTACVTAVDVNNHVRAEATEGDFRCTAIVTVGIGNLSSPGLTPAAHYQSGTINIIALIEGNLPHAALVEAVQMVTEVKARLLAGRTTSEGYPATGTSTDTVTLVLLPGPPSDYCGAVTQVGHALACACAEALGVALDKIDS